MRWLFCARMCSMQKNENLLVTFQSVTNGMTVLKLGEIFAWKKELFVLQKREVIVWWSFLTVTMSWLRYKDSKSLCSTTWNSVPYLRKLVMSRIFLYFLFQRPLSPNFLSGKRYTRKKITCVAKGRLLQKTWHILSYLSTIIPWKTLQKSIFSVKPESRSPELALVYMVTLQWKPTVEITRKAESPNATLNLLMSVDGPVYFNIIDGAKNMV